MTLDPATGVLIGLFLTQGVQFFTQWQARREAKKDAKEAADKLDAVKTDTAKIEAANKGITTISTAVDGHATAASEQITKLTDQLAEQNARRMDEMKGEIERLEKLIIIRNGTSPRMTPQPPAKP